jgi:hypothetical protein
MEVLEVGVAVVVRPTRLLEHRAQPVVVLLEQRVMGRLLRRLMVEMVAVASQRHWAVSGTPHLWAVVEVVEAVEVMVEAPVSPSHRVKTPQTLVVVAVVVRVPSKQHLEMSPCDTMVEMVVRARSFLRLMLLLSNTLSYLTSKNDTLIPQPDNHIPPYGFAFIDGNSECEENILPVSGKIPGTRRSNRFKQKLLS